MHFGEWGQVFNCVHNLCGYRAKRRSLHEIRHRSQDTVNNSTRGILKGKFDPLLVKLALGCVVIVGEEIEFLQRVQVQSNAQSTSASPLTATPSSVSFGSQIFTQPSKAQTIKVANNGTNPLSGFKFQIAGTYATDFSIPSAKNTCSSTLAPGTSCSVDVVFAPDPTANINVADRTATLEVIFSPGSTPVAVALSGTATKTPPNVYFSETTLDFGTATAGSGKNSAKLTIVNFATAAVAISALPALAGTNPGDFSGAVANTCPASLAVSASCTITWTFQPPAAVSGSRNASIVISYATGGAAPTNQAVTFTGIAD